MQEARNYYFFFHLSSGIQGKFPADILGPETMSATHCRASVWIQDPEFLSNSPDSWPIAAFYSAYAKGYMSQQAMTG